MKSIVVAFALVLVALSARAQESILPDGQYLLISVFKGEPAVRKCEIAKDKDGTVIKFPAPVDHPDFALRPIRLFIHGDKFQFNIGAGDYPPEVADRVAPGAAVYVGQLFEGQLTGVLTTAGWGEPTTSKFVLFKL